MGQAKPARAERQLSSEKTEAILEGGVQEFLAHGYAATSMDRVAKAAKVSKATVYSHFQDKEGLFSALIQRLVEQKFQSVFGMENAKVFEMPPEVVLRGFAHRALDMAAKDPQYLNFMRLILGESGRFPALARIFVRNVEQTGFKKLGQYFKSCPHLKLADPEATTRVFVGAIVHFLIVQEMLHGKDIVPMERERFVDCLVDAIVKARSPSFR